MLINTHKVFSIGLIKCSLLGLPRCLLFLLVHILVIVLLVVIVLAVLHIEQSQEEVETVLDDGHKFLHDLVALVELVGVLTDVPVEEDVEEGGDLLALDGLGDSGGLVAGLLALVSEPVSGLPGGQVALDAEGLPVGVDQLAIEDGLVEVGVRLEEEPQRDGGLTAPFNKLDVLQVLQRLLVLLRDERRHSTVLQRRVPVPVDHLPLWCRRFLSGSEVFLQGFEFGGEGVFALDEL
jgi:hypothetical protein